MHKLSFKIILIFQGTHDWERKQTELMPEKPIKSALVTCLFANHTGVAYFDNITISEKCKFMSNFNSLLWSVGMVATEFDDAIILEKFKGGCEIMTVTL